jgi:hypothetical protein
MEITFQTSKDIILAQTITVTKLTILRLVDIPEEKIVRVFVRELPDPIVLWSGSEYDAIGQWTDSDVETRIQALYA